MRLETNFLVAIPYNGRVELASYIRDRKIRRLRTGELSTHREKDTQRDRSYGEPESRKFTETEIPARGNRESERCGCSPTSPT